MENNKSHILVVDDDNRIRDLLKEYLTEKKYMVSTSNNAENAKMKIAQFKFDLIVLDVMMPGQSGYDLTKEIKGNNCPPIILLTAKGEVENRIKGLELGADDYIGKPFEPKELLLRIKNILNKTSKKPNKEKIQLDSLILDLKNGKIIGGSKDLSLNDNEIKILGILSSSPGESFSREHLIKNLGFAQERTLDVCVNRLRKKIEKNPKIPRFLKTKRGSGYVLWIN
mgnify:CR=1 FL=1